jgi:putative transposase
MKFAWIKEHRKSFELRLMCQVLGVSRSGYYAWKKRPSSKPAQRREAVVVQMRQCFAESDNTYGSPRMCRELKARGEKISENTVAKYMRESQICVRPSSRFVPQTTDSDHPHPIAPNRLDRAFQADLPDQKWVCDLTYLWTDEGWLYLSVVIDLCSRKVVGWSMDEDLKATGPAAALQMAIQHRQPRADLLHHSDRGVQYACEMYRSLLAKHGITPSMSRTGNCYDNAVAESFFGTLKTERVHKRRYRTKAQARADVFHWIECWYNRKRLHSSLGYVSPETFEAQFN